jgi:hypothetical protein
VVCPGLETTGATDVTQAWGTVTQTKATEASQTLSHSPGAATAGGYRALHFIAGGGSVGTPYGNGEVTFSLQPTRALSPSNCNGIPTAYNTFTQIHAMPSYDAVSYQWVVTWPTLTSGGMGVYTIELIAD